jgi:hypothetical protein
VLELFECALPVFPAMCLAGVVLWKIRPGSSPLCMPVFIGLSVFAFYQLDHRYEFDSFAASGMTIAGTAAFFYLDWRSIHRPAPAAWPKLVRYTVGGLIMMAIFVFIALAVTANTVYLFRR